MGRTRSGADATDRVLAVVEDLVAELRPNDPLTVGPHSDLETDLGLDSLALAELLSRLERDFGMQLPLDLLPSVATPRDLVEAIGHGTPLRSPVGPLPRVVTDHPGTAHPPRGRVVQVDGGVTTLVDSLRRHALLQPDRVHVRLVADRRGADDVAEGWSSTAVTYGELLRGAVDVARGLRRRGVGSGQSVALMLPSDATYFTSFMGVLLAGAVAVPIYPPDRPSRLAEHLQRQRGILARADVVALVTVPEAVAVARLLRTGVATLRTVTTPEELADTSGDTSGAVHDPQPDDVALLQFTSGSTGDPKGVVLTHRQLVANIDAMARAIRVGPEDVFVSWLPLYHDMGLIGAWLGSLHTGMTLVSIPPQVFLRRPLTWLQAISDHHGTISAAPNFAHELCLRRVTDEDLAMLDLSSWRLAFNGAEAVSPDTVRRFTDRFAAAGLRPEAIAPVYGLAEAAVGLAFPPLGRRPVIDRVDRDLLRRRGRAVEVSSTAPPEQVIELVACGRALPGYAIRIVSPDGHELPERVEGRVEFTGPSATSGYHQDPVATAGLVRHGPTGVRWLDTGDLGYLADGDVVITGRAKDLIIRAGINLHPQQLEQAVGAVDGVRAGCVAAIGVPDAATGTERLVVVAEARHLAAGGRRRSFGRSWQRTDVVSARIREAVRQVGPTVLGVPIDQVELVPPGSIPKTSSGKIRRAETLARLGAGRLRPDPRPMRVQLAAAVAHGMTARLAGGLRRAPEAVQAVTAWLAMALVAPVLVVLVTVLPTRASRWRAGVGMLSLLMRLTRTSVVVSGAVPAAPAVVVANHASWIDGLVLATVLPGPARVVAGEVLGRKPLQAFVLRRTGAVFVQRHDRVQGVVDASGLAALVTGGDYLVVFPEGGLAPEPGLRPFRMGAFVAAVGAGVPVVPVALRGTRWILPPGSRRMRRGTVQVDVGVPVEPGGDDWAAAVALRDAARRHLAARCGEPDAEWVRR